MKRARPPEDLNGFPLVPHHAKRSKPNPVRSPETGPIVLLNIDEFLVLFKMLDLQSLGRMAQTCRVLAKYLCAPTTGYIWIPAKWRKMIGVVHWKRTAAQKAARHLISTMFQPARFFYHVHHSADLCTVQLDEFDGSVVIAIKDGTLSYEELLSGKSLVLEYHHDETIVPTEEEFKNWFAMLKQRSAARVAKDAAERRASPELVAQKRRLKSDLDAQLVRTQQMCAVLDQAAAGKRPGDWKWHVETFAGDLAKLYGIQDELAQVTAEIEQPQPPPESTGYSPASPQYNPEPDE